MIRKQDFVQKQDFVWEIPAGYSQQMKTSVRVFSDERLLEQALGDKSFSQAINAACLPGWAGPVVVMPDVHQGYGFPIGGVAAADARAGVISPGAIGYDINCGVRLLSTQLEHEEVEANLPELASALYAHCPSGVGESGTVPLSQHELRSVCVDGAQWAVKHGYGSPEDFQRAEENGRIEGADPDSVSKRAMQRGRPQLGTLGAGNHFIEVEVVDKIFDETAASAMGLRVGSLTVLIHSGSRGFGHQICSDYVRDFQGVAKRYNIELPDRELVCAPVDSVEGRRYMSAMACAANYAFANRQVLAHHARRAFESALAGKVGDWELRPVYDIAHNMGKRESHVINGEMTEVVVHRKGATRAFGPGYQGLPPIYRQLGQPVLVPGSMGTASWVLLGTEGSMAQSYGSTCHGAGRTMSRTKAKKSVWGEDLKEELQARGIHIRAGSMAGLAEEAPRAYKDVDAVVEVVTRAGIAAKVARLRPVAVIKG